MESRTTTLAHVAVGAALVAVVLGLGNVVIRMVVVGSVAAVAAVVAALIALYLSRRAAGDQRRIDALEQRLSDLEGDGRGLESVRPVPVTETATDAEPVVGEPTSDATAAEVEDDAADQEDGVIDTTTRPASIDARPQVAKDTDVLTDDSTGLFSESYFRVALDARLSAARRHLRPVAVVIIDVVRGVDEERPTPIDPGLVADGIRQTVRDADTACRMGDGRFGLVLEDTPENGAIWTVERVRRHLTTAGHGDEVTLWAGVACYPAHAFDTEEILRQAEEALTAAREWRQDRIEVATAP